MMIRNPSPLQALHGKHRMHQTDSWLVHNAFAVGSAAIYREALRRKVPLICYIHNFRPFSVNGYLWAGKDLANNGLQAKFLEGNSARQVAKLRDQDRVVCIGADADAPTWVVQGREGMDRDLRFHAGQMHRVRGSRWGYFHGVASHH